MNNKLIVTTLNEIENKIIKLLKPGDVILTNLNRPVDIINISPINHCSVFFGTGLKDALIRLKNNINESNEEATFLLERKFYKKEYVLKDIDNWIDKVNNEDIYVLEILIFTFRPRVLTKFIKKYKEIFGYRILIEHPMTFAHWYLYLIGNKYTVFHKESRHYCFESINTLLGIMYSDFPMIHLKNYHTFDYNRYHFNSLSITNNEKYKCIFIYKAGLFKILQ